MKAFATLLAICFATLTLADQSDCVLPPLDGSDVTPSEPSLFGVIVQASTATVVIRTDSGAYSVDISDSTQLFTV